MAKVLIVEDDPDLATRLQQWLVHERHTVERADNGADALRAGAKITSSSLAHIQH